MPLSETLCLLFLMQPSAPASARVRAGGMKNLMKTLPLVLALMTLFAAHTNAGTQEQLGAYRQQSDSIDQRIVELLQERARVVAEVGNLKREAHLPVTVPGREQQVIATARDLAKGGPLPADPVRRIYQKPGEEIRNCVSNFLPTARPPSDQ